MFMVVGFFDLGLLRQDLSGRQAGRRRPSVLFAAPHRCSSCVPAEL